MNLNNVLLNVLNACKYTNYTNGYFFHSEMSIVNNQMCISISCDKLIHSIDLCIHEPNNEVNSHGCDCEYEIDFYHNDDVYLYTMTDNRLDLLKYCIQHEIEIIIEMNE